MKPCKLLALTLAAISVARAEPLGVITREIADQVDVYEVKTSSNTDTLKLGDIVKVSRADTVLGEATVLKIGPGTIVISLKRHFSVKNSDSVEFYRASESPSLQAYDPYVKVGSEGDSFLKWLYFIDDRATVRVDNDTVCFRVKMQAKSNSGLSSLNQSSFFYYLMHRKSATYESAGEIGPTAQTTLKGSSDPQIGNWGKTRHISRGSLESALYELAFPDEKT